MPHLGLRLLQEVKEGRALEKKEMLCFGAPRGLCRGPDICWQVVGGESQVPLATHCSVPGD